MCPICLPFLGPNCRPHTEANCSLKNGMNCSICGKGKHFMKDCPRHTRSIQRKYIPSVKPEPINSYMLPNKIMVYIEYLNTKGLKFDTDLASNRRLVAEHLKQRGLVLVNPINTQATPDCGCKVCLQKIPSK
jgi:hypothetical protein